MTEGHPVERRQLSRGLLGSGFVEDDSGVGGRCRVAVSGGCDSGVGDQHGSWHRPGCGSGVLEEECVFTGFGISDI